MPELKGYHAHVYYDPATRPIAERLREAMLGRFAVRPGAFSDEPIGPHPISQFSVIFQTEEFQNVVPWLMLNREGLDVLIHPLTESSYDDHSKNAIWIGKPVPMRLDVLRPTYRDSLLPGGAAVQPA
jgi:aromatic ring-cleaving dioxygenase